MVTKKSVQLKRNKRTFQQYILRVPSLTYFFECKSHPSRSLRHRFDRPQHDLPSEQRHPTEDNTMPTRRLRNQTSPFSCRSILIFGGLSRSLWYKVYCRRKEWITRRLINHAWSRKVALEQFSNKRYFSLQNSVHNYETSSINKILKTTVHYGEFMRPSVKTLTLIYLSVKTLTLIFDPKSACLAQTNRSSKQDQAAALQWLLTVETKKTKSHLVHDKVVCLPHS